MAIEEFGRLRETGKMAPTKAGNRVQNDAFHRHQAPSHGHNLKVTNRRIRQILTKRRDTAVEYQPIDISNRPKHQIKRKRGEAIACSIQQRDVSAIILKVYKLAE